MRTKSPGSSSRTSVAPVMSSAHVSDATTQPRPRRPSTRGRKPRGSTMAYRVRPTVMRSERSEEHTSELQSRLHLVCRLLLEKKKKIGSLTHPPLSRSVEHD